MTRLPPWGSLLVLSAALLLSAPLAAQSSEEGLQAVPATHSHNDYYQSRPLLDALDNGMVSIEADIFYVEIPFRDTEGETRALRQLWVAHDWEEIEGNVAGFSRTRGTLEQLYLDPLWEIYQQQGTIYPQTTLLLHADMKTATETTWRVLENTLRNYPGLFTRFDVNSEEVMPGPVTVYTNDEPSAEVLSEFGVIHSTADGRFGDIYDDSVWDTEAYQQRSWRMPIVSSNLQAYNDIEQMFEFLVPKEEIVAEYGGDRPDLTVENLASELDADGWALATELIEDGKIEVADYLRERMQEAERRGAENDHLMRFWASPDAPWFWEIVAPLEHVVLLTDHPQQAASYLAER